MYARDSLLNLRLHSNKPSASHAEVPGNGAKQSRRRPRSATLPIDDLRAKITAKKLRTDPNSSAKKSVNFNFQKNQYHEFYASREDLSKAWASCEDSDRVRSKNLACIAEFRAGTMDPQTDCIRGLEWHTCPVLMQKKIQNGRNFVKALLDQQDFLEKIMGSPNSLVLGQMSKFLSSEDVKDAIFSAKMDAEEAARIHSEDVSSENLKPSLSSKPSFNEPGTVSDLLATAIAEAQSVMFPVDKGTEPNLLRVVSRTDDELSAKS